jgi:hypothetical protein
MPAMASRVSPLARSNSRATMLRGASMLASKPSGWKCQRITWQALGNVILFMPASLFVAERGDVDVVSQTGLTWPSESNHSSRHGNVLRKT